MESKRKRRTFALRPTRMCSCRGKEDDVIIHPYQSHISVTTTKKKGRKKKKKNMPPVQQKILEKRFFTGHHPQYLPLPRPRKITRKLSRRCTHRKPSSGKRGYLGPANVQLILIGVFSSSFDLPCTKRCPGENTPEDIFSRTVHLSHRVASTGCARRNSTDRPVHRLADQPIRQS